LGFASKKTLYATEQDRPDIALARQLWAIDQAGLDFERLVFVDETGTTTRMVRTHGWGRKGQRLIGRAPHGHWLTQTFVAGLAHDGILAPVLLPCPMTGELFRQWLEEWLIPEMRPRSIVVLDNLAAHKVQGVRQSLEAAGMGLLYLPAYSPDFNPIELAFAKIKRALRRMAPRSFEAICEALNAILQTFSTGECAKYLQHAGYVQS
jgi:putative transposase